MLCQLILNASLLSNKIREQDLQPGDVCFPELDPHRILLLLECSNVTGGEKLWKCFSSTGGPEWWYDHVLEKIF